MTTSDKLVCVDASPVPAGDFLIGPMLVEDMVYVAREVDPPQHSTDPGGVRVVGVSVFKESGLESWWRADRFRRLEDVQAERSTNIPYVLHEPLPERINGLWYKVRIVAYPPLKPKKA